MSPPTVYCCDIGSVEKNRFGWARGEGSEQLVSGTDIRQLVDGVAKDLIEERGVALGFECPLFVPVRSDPLELTSGRRGDGNRPWSAGGGAGSLATGLTEVVWILCELRNRVGPGVQAFLCWQDFLKAKRGLFLWEAFVSGKAHGKTHVEDAKRAVRAFAAALPDLESANAIQEPVVHSLVGAAMLRTGWSDQLAVLKTPSVVIMG